MRSWRVLSCTGTSSKPKKYSSLALRPDTKACLPSMITSLRWSRFFKLEMSTCLLDSIGADGENLDVVFFSKRQDQRIEAAEDFLVRVERVDHESDLHAGARALNELDDQALREVAGPDDVELNVNRRRGLLERSKKPLPRFSVVELGVKRVALNETRLGGLIEAPVERAATRSVAE